jgi:hypothetical protein
MALKRKNKAEEISPSVLDILNDWKRKLGAMRAEDSDYEEYADKYQERANKEMDGDADWELFEQLWEERHNSNDDMAELLAEVLGVAHDETLSWLEDY